MTNFYAPLPHRAALLVEGPAAREFLQGQLTCDVAQLSDTRTLPAACCTPKGRVVFDCQVAAGAQVAEGGDAGTAGVRGAGARDAGAHGAGKQGTGNSDAVFLLTQGSVAQQALALLGKYILFSKAEARDASAEWTQVGFWGKDAVAALSLPVGEQHACLLRDGIYWIQCDESGARFEALLPAPSQAALLAKFGGAFQLSDESKYREQEIRAGLPHVEAATADAFLPQHLNYDALGHLSFTKGCYTGQEVVARTHYKGKLKTALVSATCPAPAAPGTRLHAPAAPQPIGTIINAAPTPETTRLLAVINQTALSGEVRLAAPDGPPLKFESNAAQPRA